MKEKYTLRDVNQMSYYEFEQIMQTLVSTIQDSGIKFEAVVPVLRTGAIPATIIAYKLNIINMLPIQVKYDYTINKPNQLLPLVLPLDNKLITPANILVVEANTHSGTSAEMVHTIVKNSLPTAHIHYATVTRAFKKIPNDLPMYKNYFWGVMTNEAFEADSYIQEKLNLRPNIVVFPWEDAEAELKDINSVLQNS